MENEINKTDSYFRERLVSYEQNPPESSWENISRKLGERKKKRMIILVFRIAAGMAILLSTGLGYYWINVKNQHSGNRQLTEQINAEKSARPTTKTGDETSVKPNVANGRPVPANTNPVALEESSEITSSKTEQAAPKQPGIAVNAPSYPPDREISVSESAATVSEEMLAMAYLTPLKGYPVAGSPENAEKEGIDNIRTMTPEEAASLLLADYNEEFADEKAAVRPGWMVGSEVAPLYSDRNISSDKLESSRISDLNSNESGLIAYAGGFRIGYSKGKRFSVQSGIYYSRYGQQKPINNSSSSLNYIEVSNSTGTISGVIESKNVGTSQSYYNDKISLSNAPEYPLAQGTSQDVTLQQIFDYFEVPLIMKYKLIDRKIDFSFTGGMVTNFLVGNTVRLLYDGSATTVGETSDINRINYQGSLGLGLEYPVSKNIDFTVEPRFRYYLNPIGTSSDIVVHPYSFGFFAGLNYRF